MGDQVYLKISHMKGVMRFWWKGKLSLMYVGPYDILQCVSEVAYRLAFPEKLASVHPFFHVSMSKKFLGDPTSILPFQGLGVDEYLFYEEVLVEILYRQIKLKQLRNKKIAVVKLWWWNHLVEGATWEAETDMRSRDPHLFSH